VSISDKSQVFYDSLLFFLLFDKNKKQNVGRENKLSFEKVVVAKLFETSITNIMICF
jgi:hypothetical protein